MNAGDSHPIVAHRGEDLERRRRKRIRLVATGLIALVYYGYAWFVQPDRPQLRAVFDDPPTLVNITERGILPQDAATPLAQYQQNHWGWLGAWYDQFHYAREARALGHLQIPGQYWDRVHNRPSNDAPRHEEAASFNFGLGYPMVGAVFYDLGFRGDPFVVPDGLLFALSAMLALALAERVLQPLTALLVVNVLVLTGPFVLYFVMPYSTSLTVVAVLASLLVLTGDRYTWKIGFGLGIAIALAFAARYSEIVWMGLLLIPLLFRWRKAWRVIVALAISMGVMSVFLAIAQQIAFGSPFDTPYTYSHGGSDASLNGYHASRIAPNFWGVWFTGDRNRLFGVAPILRSFPWAALAPIGLYLLFRARHRLRWHLLLAAAIGALSELFFSAYYAGGTKDLILWTIRYHVSWFPLWGVLAGVVVERLLAMATGDSRLVAEPESVGSSTGPPDAGG